MRTNPFGNTGLAVSQLGAGLARIGYELTLRDIDEAGQVLNAALDGGVNFLDTSACYDISEELIGRTISHRRGEFILATKCGHVTGGARGRAWSAQTIEESIDRSLSRMKTDHLDLIQLHSCGVEELERGEVIEALLHAKGAGKARFVGYSGDNDAALWAINSGHFDALQTSFNVVDQHARTRLFGPAKAKGMGIIIKRPVANGAWGSQRSPYGYAGEYFRRAQQVSGMGPIPASPATASWRLWGSYSPIPRWTRPLSGPGIRPTCRRTSSRSRRSSLSPKSSWPSSTVGSTCWGPTGFSRAEWRPSGELPSPGNPVPYSPCGRGLPPLNLPLRGVYRGGEGRFVAPVVLAKEVWYTLGRLLGHSEEGS